jgi:type I restriction-modification system DNA methylase subunit
MAILNINEIKRKIDDLYEDLSNAVEKSKFAREEKLKIEVITVFTQFFKQYDIDFTKFIDYEVSTIGTVKIKGRIDALYGSLIIEFKKYNKLSTSKELEKAKKQINEKYLDKIPKKAKKNYVGIIFDGKNIVFIKYDQENNSWKTDCRTFDVFTLYDFLLLLSGLFKKTMSSNFLKQDFSMETELAKDVITILYIKLNENLDKNKRIRILFSEWDKTFRYIYGGVLNEDKLVSDFKEISETILKSETKLYVDRFLFVIYTYYAFIVKLIASEIVCVSLKLPFDSPSEYLMKEKNLRDSLRTIEDGKFFKELIGVENYIEGGFFSWYLDCWDSDIENVIINILSKINEYNPNTLIDYNHNSVDILRNLYQQIVPKRIRHDLGEYYTPPWLAKLTIEECHYDGDLKYKLLDPGCGSGSFLIEIINRIKNKNSELSESDLLDSILTRVIGFDVNPVSVLTARTNYLLAISDLIIHKKQSSVTLPVYLADSVITPTTEGKGELKKDVYNVSTIEGVFRIPKDILDENRIGEVLRIIEEYLEKEYPPDDFRKIFNKKIQLESGSEQIILEFYKSLLELHKKKKNKIWVKIIHNSFAPLLYFDFDFVIGNPPWIKWEFLSEEYKKKLRVLYLDIYKLYSYKGMKAGMGFAHDDISIVFTYVCMDKYLKNGGVLAFVLKQTLYKSIAGKEFRKFQIEKNGKQIPVKILKVIDLLDLKPFKYSGSETSVAFIKKGEETHYPVPYFVWKVKK